MSKALSLAIHPGQGLGHITLGSSLHETLSSLKSQPSVFQTIDIFYSPSEPLSTPVILNLPKNGFRLRFDGPTQRLRLIEILDFSLNSFTYDNKALIKSSDDVTAGRRLDFRQIYDRLFGPTFPGEYIPPDLKSGSDQGSYVLSYPGIAFTFPLQDSAWSRKHDFVSLLSSSSAGPAKSFAIFDGPSWQEARTQLYLKACPNPREWSAHSRGKDMRPEEIDHVAVKGDGVSDVFRRNASTFQIVLNQTTPQDLLTELGPPDAIYRKSDRRLSIHKTRDKSHSRARSSGYESTDTGRSSYTNQDDSDDQGRPKGDEFLADAAAECFYNYFHHGIDVFVSRPTERVKKGMGGVSHGDERAEIFEPDQLVATKILLHGNIPGSYPFNRYRRCRWTIRSDSVETDEDNVLTSEMSFGELSEQLQHGFQNDAAYDGKSNNFQQGMVLNRGWGNSPGSSCELLGGWEESDKAERRASKSGGEDGPGLGNTTLYGFPGMVFEVLKNDKVSCLTIY